VKVSAPSGDEEKINRRARRDRRVFPWKDKKYKSFYGYGLLFAFRFSGDRDKRMSEEKAEAAKVEQKKRKGIMAGNTIGFPTL
jgi:hypothetical protein